MSILFNDVELAQLRTLVHTHSRQEREQQEQAQQEQQAHPETRTEYELEFRFGTYTSKPGPFRPGVSESAFRRLLRSHTGHYPSFQSQSKSIRELNQNELYNRDTCSTRQKEVVEKMDIPEWNMRISFAKETNRWVNAAEQEVWNNRASYHQRSKQRTSFMMDRSIRLDLTHVTTVTVSNGGSKTEHSYEVELEVLPHRDHELYTPQVLSQTILPAFNSVLQILQDSRCPLGASQIETVHQSFRLLTGFHVSEYRGGATSMKLLSRTDIHSLTETSCVVYARSNDALQTYFLVAMDAIYIHSARHGWRQIAFPQMEMKQWNGTLLSGQFDGMGFFAESMAYCRGQPTERSTVADFLAHQQTMETLQKEMANTYKRKMFQIKEHIVTQSWHQLQAGVVELMDRFEKRGPFTLDAIVFTTHKGSFLWNLQTSFFLYFSKTIADPFLYGIVDGNPAGGIGSVVAKCPVPNFCVAANLSPNSLGEFRISKFPSEERKIGQFELIRICSDHSEADFLSQVHSKLTTLNHPITRGFFLDPFSTGDVDAKTVRNEENSENSENKKTTESHQMDQPVDQFFTKRFKSIESATTQTIPSSPQKSQTITSTQEKPSSHLHKPLPTTPIAVPSQSPTTHQPTQPPRVLPNQQGKQNKPVIKKKRKTKTIKWKKCSGISGSGLKTTSSPLSVVGGPT